MTLLSSSLRLDRRALFGLGAGALSAGVLPAAARAASGGERVLSFRNLHTGETLDARYFDGSAYDPQALTEINRVLRDHRTGEVHGMSVDLLDLVHDLRRKVESRSPIQIISGYRSPKTNAQLAANSSGVAKKSYHMKGMATDFSLDDVDLAYLHKAAKAMERGGVGAYYKSGFVHVDVGPVRYW